MANRNEESQFNSSSVPQRTVTLKQCLDHPIPSITITKSPQASLILNIKKNINTNLSDTEEIDNEVSYDPNAISKNPSIYEDVPIKTQDGPPIVPPRPKHLSKKYGMISYLASINTELLKIPRRKISTSKGLPRSESLPSFLCLNHEITKNTTSVAKVRKISYNLHPNDASRISRNFTQTSNAISTGFTREIRKVKSTLSLARKNPLFLRQINNQNNTNKINENKNEEFKYEIAVDLVESDSNSNSNRSSVNNSELYHIIQKRHISLPIYDSNHQEKNIILKRRYSAPELLNTSQLNIDEDQYNFYIPERRHPSFIISNNKNAKNNSLYEDAIQNNDTEDEKEGIAIFDTTYSSDEDEEGTFTTPNNETVENEVNKLSRETSIKSFKKMAQKINTLKRNSSSRISSKNSSSSLHDIDKTILCVNTLLNLKKNNSSESLHNLTKNNKKCTFQPTPSSPKNPRKNLRLETSLNSLEVPHYSEGNARLRRAALVVRAASSMIPQDLNYCCDNCRNKRRQRDEKPDDRQFDREGNLTILGRCWHRLHVSQARLNSTSRTSELFAAFAMVALVELQINTPCTVPDICWILFSMNTTLLVGVNILALMISTFILPNINAVTRLHPTALIAESPHDTMRWFIEGAWGLSTFLNLLLSIVNVSLISWVKFWDLGVAGAITSTAIVVPSLAIFILVAVHFYRILEASEKKVSKEETHGQDESNQNQGMVNPAFVHTEDTRGSDDVAIDIIQTMDENAGDTMRDNNADGSPTPRGLQWRSLHVSLAKLEATSSASELMSGFATMATVELQTNSPTVIPSWVFVLLAINSTILVLLNVFALMISTFILPSVEAITHQHGSNLVETSPHEYLRWYIEIAWVFSTVLGMFVFLFEVIILSWTKFWDFSFDGAALSTGIILVSMIIFIGFTSYFYYTLVDHKCETTDIDLKLLEDMKQKLDDNLALQNDKNKLSKKKKKKKSEFAFDELFTGERLI